jgi:hypothetical protein
MNDEIAHGIAMELRLIREELQKLTSTINFIADRSHNSNQAGKSYKGIISSPPDPRPAVAQRPRGSRRPEDSRRQWHLPQDAN